ncbi:hypothetical protein [Desulfovibrio ferrophilus]|uniref:Lipoprotein n=1 Tax=Desulfovibrio ferrophilus TaxID=241368 RepID=A0A2Z6B458_9BACT|nr:hypothetical protein [Desulfovibrio ferrophilus]BBD10156.1 lipoprotein [Desulfovibrio ferrophilus]
MFKNIFVALVISISLVGCGSSDDNKENTVSNTQPKIIEERTSQPLREKAVSQKNKEVDLYGLQDKMIKRSGKETGESDPDKIWETLKEMK